MPIGFPRRRFGSRGRRVRSFREPVVWNRFVNSIAVVNGTLISATLFDPAQLIAGNVDERLTLRRLILDFSATEQVVSVAADVDILASVRLAGKGQPDRNPNMLAAADQDADLLDWFAVPVRRSGASTAQFFGADFTHRRNIRAMRKIDVDQILLVTATAINVNTGVALADGTERLRWLGSALFSRTSR